MRLRGQHKTKIGLEIGAKTIKVAQLQIRHGVWQSLNGLCIKRVSPDSDLNAEEVKRVTDAIYRHDFQGQSVVASVPREAQLFAVVDAPSAGSGAPVSQITRQQLAMQYHYAPQEIESDYWRLPAINPGHEATKGVAVGCKNKDAETLLNLLEEGGLDVEALDVSSLAIGRVCKATGAAINNGEITAVVDLGWRYSSMTLHLNDVVIYERILHGANLQGLYETLGNRYGMTEKACDRFMERFGIDDLEDQSIDGATQLPSVQNIIRKYGEALIEEIKISLSYVNHEYPDQQLGRVVIAGGGAQILGLPDYFKTSMDVECDLLRTDLLIQNKVPDHIHQMHTAIGLCLYDEEAQS